MFIEKEVFEIGQVNNLFVVASSSSKVKCRQLPKVISRTKCNICQGHT